MPFQSKILVWSVLLSCSRCFALEPKEILVVVNANMPASTQIGRYYCQKRAVPYGNILYLQLGKRLRDNIDRDDYERLMAEPIRRELLRKRELGAIKCLLTTYGVPIGVGRRGPLEGQQDKLNELAGLIEKEKKFQQSDPNAADSDRPTPDELKESKQRLAKLQLQADRINGKETNASVDSELSMVLIDDYELYRWQPNKLLGDTLGLAFQTFMVSRLDGPDTEIVTGLVDKAISAERTGLTGVAYFDSRGIKYSKSSLFGFYDQSLRDLAMLTRLRTGMSVKEEQTAELFAPGSCPQAAVYCGWYSLRKYVDAFDFVEGAVGYHIASIEAGGLHDPNSSNWCPAMLRDGITATLGPVAEPYLHTFPQPKLFFGRLYRGDCLVEAYYRTNPFNSWQLVLIGDPLYRPFKKHQPPDADS